MNTKMKLITATIAAVAVTGGVGAGIAAADTPTTAPSSSPSSSSAAKADQNGTDQAKKSARHRSLQQRALHGQVTLGGKKHRIVDFQRGTVKKVSATSVTVKSKDGFTETYVVNTATRVRKDRAKTTVSSVEEADHVRVVAVKSGGTVTARVIRDRTK